MTTSPEQNRADTIRQAGDALHQHAVQMPFDADYEAAIWLQAEDVVRDLPPTHTHLSDAFLTQHPDVDAGETRVIDDLRRHPWWSVARFLRHRFDRRRTP